MVERAVLKSEPTTSLLISRKKVKVVRVVFCLTENLVKRFHLNKKCENSNFYFEKKTTIDGASL